MSSMYIYIPLSSGSYLPICAEVFEHFVLLFIDLTHLEC